MKTQLVTLSILSAILFLQGCSSDKQIAETTPSQVSNIPSLITEEVLVIIDNEKITQSDLDYTIERTISSNQVSMLSKDVKKEILDSLILTRLLANVANKTLSSEEKIKLEFDVKTYKLQLLAKQAIQKNVTPEPVTQQMVVAYYNKYPEKFGGRKIRSYEMISGSTKLNPELRNILISTLEKVKNSNDWKKAEKKQNLKNVSLVYSQAEVDEAVLHPQLQALIKPMKVNEVSSISFIEGKPYLVRILADKIIAPKPLSSVSVDIRKALVPVQLKKAIESMVDKLRQQANIQYFDSK